MNLESGKMYRNAGTSTLGWSDGARIHVGELFFVLKHIGVATYRFDSYLILTRGRKLETFYTWRIEDMELVER